MYTLSTISRAISVFIFLCSFHSSISAWQTLTTELDLHCTQGRDNLLSCQYRPLFPGTVSDIEASVGTLSLPVELSGDDKEDLKAIFFLIDTSDPARQNVIRKNIEQVERLLVASKPDYRLGLATFDKKLHILAPIGSSKSQITSALKGIKAEGRTTELYRSLLLTIEKLSRINASKKAIYLFSDGQAEDKAYFHTDVVKAARKKRVVINSIGYPRSVSLSVALQTLRRLSEETGGFFIEANNNFELDNTFYRQPYKNIDAGSSFSIDFNKLINATTINTPKIAILFKTDIGNIKIDAPVNLPAITPNRPVSPVSPVVSQPPAPMTQPEIIRVVSPPLEPENINFWLWYGLPVALVILFLISMITLILIYRKQPDKGSITNITLPQNKPFAYLVTQEEDSKRYPILNTTWRIGRGRDNELTLDDNSVSRLHAEIHRYNNGSFFILDMQSLNGVYVNEEQVSNRKLQEGDIIEIGDIFLRFTQHAEDYQLDDDTAIQRTKMPAH